MKHFLFYFILPTLFLSCNTKKKEVIDIQFLNGYWEIDHVINSEGKKKEFQFNAFVDYFETKKNNGFRAKVKPKFNGKYRSNFQKTNYVLKKNTDTIIITYNTATSTIKDKLFRATEKELGIKTENGNLYFYRPFTPIKINSEN